MAADGSVERATVSVRGEAGVSVAPDVAELFVRVEGRGDGNAVALAAANRVLEAVVLELVDLGGAVVTPDTARAPLVWSVQSISTEDEHDWDPEIGKHRPTGMTNAVIALAIRVRDMALLDSAAAAGPQHGAHVQYVQWEVDRDNPAWAGVRADAIAAAITKGRDYAAALGGRLLSLEHLADSGLLGTDSVVPNGQYAVGVSGRRGSSVGPSLGPVPQQISATVEARFIAEVRPI